MEALIRAIILGIVQGLTEFLPVSSSGHLELAKYLLNDKSLAEESLLMTVTLHAATALSTIVIFRKDIYQIFQGLLAFRWNEETRFSVNILISMVPAALVGFFLEEQIEWFFNRNVLLVGFMLFITGLLLLLADRAKNTQQSVKPVSALIIGLAQAIAILPGISRSGATISTSVLLQIDRSKAARFSFLMVVPLILGKMAKDILDGALTGQDEQILALIVGFVAAFLTGLWACQWMIQLVKRAKLTWFALYCFLAGIFSIVLYLVH